MARPIMETLREIRHGAMLDEAAVQLADAVRSVFESGKAAQFKLTLTIKPASRGSVRTVILEDSISVKLPEPDKEVTIFFPTGDGTLSRSDPAQLPLGLRPVESVDTQTGEIITQTQGA